MTDSAAFSRQHSSKPTRYRFRRPVPLVLAAVWIAAGPLNPAPWFLELAGIELQTMAKAEDRLGFVTLPTLALASLAIWRLRAFRDFSIRELLGTVLKAFLAIVILSPFISGLVLLAEGGLSVYVGGVAMLYLFGILLLAIPYHAIVVGLPTLACLLLALALSVRRLPP